MVELSKAEVAALEKFKKRVSEALADAQYSVARRGKGYSLELDVLINRPGKAGAEAIQAAANNVLVADGVYIVPHLSPSDTWRAEALRIPANVTGHSGDRDRSAHRSLAGSGFVS